MRVGGRVQVLHARPPLPPRPDRQTGLQRMVRTSDTSCRLIKSLHETQRYLSIERITSSVLGFIT